MNNPAILFIASGSIWAGAEMQVYTLASSCKVYSRVHVLLFCEGSMADHLRSNGVDVHIIDETRHGFPVMLKAAYQLIARLKVDAIHSHGYKENVVACILGLIFRLPCVWTIHGEHEVKYRFWQLKQSLPALFNWLSGRFLLKKIVSVSTELAEKLQRQYPADKIVVIPNGINIQQIENSAQGEVELPAQKASFKIAYVGRLVALKRVDLILESYALLYEKYALDYELLIVGDGEQRESLQAMAAELGVARGVHFLGHRSDSHRLMRLVDCLIMASDHEGLPMAVLEAIALKCPVVSHAVGHIPQVLDEGRNGYLVYQQQPQAFADAIVRCRQTADTDLPDRAQRFVAEHFSHDNNARMHMALYRELCGLSVDTV